MRGLFLDTALLPTGWADHVALDVEDGTIAAVTQAASPAGRERLPGIALPGLPNLHSHTFQRAMSGLTETAGATPDSFWTWRQVMYRFLAHLTPDDVEAIAAFAFMEMLEQGFTAVAEFHYLHNAPDGRPYADPAELSARIAAAAHATGIGLTLLPVLYQQSGFAAAPPTDAQRRFTTTLDAYATLLDRAAHALAPLEDAVLGTAPHSLRAVTPGALAHLQTLRPHAPIHIHVAEQRQEVDDCLAWSAQRPVAWLLSHAPVDPRWTLIHATHIDAHERAALARSAAVAGLCPITEANLGDGLFPARDYPGPWGVGSDSNVDITAPGELRMLEYGQRLHHRARNVLAAPAASTGATLYRSALAGGAQACARPIGQLAPGHRADLLTLDPSHPDLAHPGDTRIDAYVFGPARTAIDHVLVGGRTLVRSGRHHAREAITTAYKATLSHLA